MSEEQSLLASHEAQPITQLDDVGQKIAHLEDQVRTLEQQISTAEATHKSAWQSQLAAVQRERLDLLQRANTLRAQLELSAVTPSAVPLNRRGAQVYPAAEVNTGLSAADGTNQEAV